MSLTENASGGSWQTHGSECLCHFADGVERGIWSIGRFVTRDVCGDWHPVFQLIYILSNATITICYLLIASALIYAATSENKSDHQTALTISDRTRVRATYAAFILFCGLGHLEGYLSFKWPAYHAFTLWHLATAAVSVAAAHLTIRMRDRIMINF